MLREQSSARRTASAATLGRLSLARQEELIAYLFILPSLLGFVAFLVVPMVASLGISFYDWELLAPPRFVGLANFQTLLSDRVFHEVLWNTVYYTLGLVPLNLVVSLGLAVWLNTRLRGLTLYRMAFFMPVVTVTARWPLSEPSAPAVPALNVARSSASPEYTKRVYERPKPKGYSARGAPGALKWR